MTGDKPETAKSIAISTKLIRTDYVGLEFIEDKTNFGAAYKKLSEFLDELVANRASNLLEDSSNKKYYLIINGSVLNTVFNNELLSDLLYDAVSRCICAVFCRVSPKQKSQVVELIKAKEPLTTVLCIGDGANDVPMIMEAHIGVGISGKEGTQVLLIY